jgi:hypothetical protein
MNLEAVYFPATLNEQLGFHYVYECEKALKENRAEELNSRGLPNLYRCNVLGKNLYFVKHPEKEVPVIFFTLGKAHSSSLNTNIIHNTYIMKNPELERGEVSKYHGFNNLMIQIILDYLVPKFGVVSTDRSQTYSGRRIWEQLMEEVFHTHGNYFIYMWDFSTPDKTKLTQLLSFRSFKDLEGSIYGNTEEFRKILLLISRKRLENHQT